MEKNEILEILKNSNYPFDITVEDNYFYGITIRGEEVLVTIDGQKFHCCGIGYDKNQMGAEVIEFENPRFGNFDLPDNNRLQVEIFWIKELKIEAVKKVPGTGVTIKLPDDER